MPDVKISALPTATTIADADILVVNQGSPAATKKISYGTLLPVAATNTGTFGNDHEVAQVTIDSKGRTTAAASVPINASNISVGTLPVDHGGTGAATHTAGAYLKGNGTAAITTAATVPVADIAGTLPVAKGGTGAATLTGFVKASGTNAMTASATVALGSEVSGTLPVANGGTGAATLAASGYLKGNGTSAITSQTGVPVADITGTLGFDKGGTGQTTRQAAMDALAGATTNGHYLRGDGADVVMSAIQAGDIPTLNQNTTGTAANVTGVVAVANGGTGATTLASGGYLKGNGTNAITTQSGVPANDISGTIVVAGTGLNGGSVSTGGTISANFGTTAGTITQGGTAVLKAGDQMTGKLGIGTAPTTAALTVDSSGIKFPVFLTPQTIPYIAERYSASLGITSLGVSATRIVSFNVISTGLSKGFATFASISQTSSIPDGLQISAYCVNSISATVTIRNATASAITFDAGATVELTIFKSATLGT
jgi:hypothetical protein